MDEERARLRELVKQGEEKQQKIDAMIERITKSRDERRQRSWRRWAYDTFWRWEIVYGDRYAQ